MVALLSTPRPSDGLQGHRLLGHPGCMVDPKFTLPKNWLAKIWSWFCLQKSWPTLARKMNYVWQRGIGLPKNLATCVDWWRVASLSTPRAARKGTASLVALTAWWVWKQRNVVVFDNVRPNLVCLLSTVKSEARLWIHAGVVLLETPGE